MKLVADNAARATFNTAFIREDHVSIVLRDVAIRWTTVNALLSHALEAGFVVDDANVRAIAIHVVIDQRKLSLDRCRIKNLGS